MRIEFTDGTAIWDWSQRTVQVGTGTKLVYQLAPGDVLPMVDHYLPDGERTVARFISDPEFLMDGGKWEPVCADAGAHPRAGVLYKGTK